MPETGLLGNCSVSSAMWVVAPETDLGILISSHLYHSLSLLSLIRSFLRAF